MAPTSLTETPGFAWRKGSEVILAAIETQVPFAEQLRVQTTESLADANTLGKMSFRGGEESDQVSTAGADIVDRERFRAGWTTDVDNFTCLFIKIDKSPAPITEHRADDQKTFIRLVS